MRVKLDRVPLSSLQGRCCEKLSGRLSSQHLALRSVCEHMGSLVPPLGGLLPDPHWCDLTGAWASPPRGPITTQAPEQIAQCLRTLLYGRWFFAPFPKQARTSKSHTQNIVLTLGFLISNLPHSWILGCNKSSAYTGKVTEGSRVCFDRQEDSSNPSEFIQGKKERTHLYLKNVKLFWPKVPGTLSSRVLYQVKKKERKESSRPQQSVFPLRFLESPWTIWQMTPLTHCCTSVRGAELQRVAKPRCKEGSASGKCMSTDYSQPARKCQDGVRSQNNRYLNVAHCVQRLRNGNKDLVDVMALSLCPSSSRQ